MAENNVTAILDTIVSRLEKVAQSKTVIGDPVTVGTTTIVPVTKVSIGFGAGGGEGSTGGGQQSSGFGGGGGGGAMVEAVAFIVMHDGKVSLLSTKGNKLETVLDAIPGLLEKVAAMTAKKGEKKADEPEAKE